MNVCHVYPYEIADGPANMALDEALLEAVGTGESVAHLRTYGWSEPTLSLGYFQRLAEVRADSRWRDVRDGAAADGRGRDLAPSRVDLRARGAGEAPAGAAEHAALSSGACGDYQVVWWASVFKPFVAGKFFLQHDCERSRPLLCFTDRSAEDIVFEGIKIVGSAQRRRGGAVLQHGSILLARSSRTPELPGLCDVADLSDDPRRMVRQAGGMDHEGPWAACALPGGFRARFACRRSSGTLGRYRDPAWTEIR